MFENITAEQITSYKTLIIEYAIEYLPPIII